MAGSEGDAKPQRTPRALIESLALMAVLATVVAGTTYLYHLSEMTGAVRLGIILAAAAGLTMLWRRQRMKYVLERYKTEAEHRALVGHYRQLSRFANDVMLLMDETGRIVELNDRAVETYGWSRDELLRMTIRDLRDPAELPILDGQWDETGRRGSLVFETTHRRRDGSCFPVEVSSRAMPLEGLVYRQSIIRDISERKALDEKLRGALETLAQSEAHFRAVFEQAAVGMAHLSLDGRFLRVNARYCQILGYSREEMLDMAFSRLVPAEEAGLTHEFLQSFLRGDLVRKSGCTPPRPSCVLRPATPRN
jgi:PAS domain S-box-containing protein